VTHNDLTSLTRDNQEIQKEEGRPETTQGEHWHGGPVPLVLLDSAPFSATVDKPPAPPQRGASPSELEEWLEVLESKEARGRARTCSHGYTHGPRDAAEARHYPAHKADGDAFTA